MPEIHVVTKPNGLIDVFGFDQIRTDSVPIVTQIFFDDLRKAATHALGSEFENIEVRHTIIGEGSRNTEPLIIEVRTGPKKAHLHTQLHRALAMCTEKILDLYYIGGLQKLKDKPVRVQIAVNFRNVGEHGQIYAVTEHGISAIKDACWGLDEFESVDHAAFAPQIEETLQVAGEMSKELDYMDDEQRDAAFRGLTS